MAQVDMYGMDLFPMSVSSKEQHSTHQTSYHHQANSKIFQELFSYVAKIIRVLQRKQLVRPLQQTEIQQQPDKIHLLVLMVVWCLMVLQELKHKITSIFQQEIGRAHV